MQGFEKSLESCKGRETERLSMNNVMGKVEEIKKALALRMGAWHESEMGIIPSKVTVTVDGELVLVRFKDVLCQSELNLIQGGGGKELLREINQRLCEEEFPTISEIVSQLTGLELMEIHSATSMRLHEKIYILTLNRPLQEACDA